MKKEQQKPVFLLFLSFFVICVRIHLGTTVLQGGLPLYSIQNGGDADEVRFQRPYVFRHFHHFITDIHFHESKVNF